MKYVNLFGFTTAEKLIAFENAIDDLYSLLGDLGWYVTKEGYNSETTIYNTQYITQDIGENSFIGRPIYFANNHILAVVNTYNSANGEYTITNPQNIKGEKGDTVTPDITNLTAQVNKLQEDLTQGLNDLENKDLNQDVEIADAKNQILDVNEDLQETNNSLNNLSAIVSEQDVEIADAKNQILDVNEDLQETNNSLNNLSATVSEQGVKIATLENTPVSPKLYRHIFSFFINYDSSRPTAPTGSCQFEYISAESRKYSDIDGSGEIFSGRRIPIVTGQGSDSFVCAIVTTLRRNVSIANSYHGYIVTVKYGANVSDITVSASSGETVEEL